MSTLSIKSQLIRIIGLSNEEAEIYLTCISNSPINPTRLASLTEIKRSSLYVHITKLEKLNLISFIHIGKRRMVTATSPSLLMEIIERRKEEIEGQRKNIEPLISRLKIISENQEYLNESTEIFKGQGGIITLLERITRAQKDLYWIGSIETILSAIKEEKLFRLLTWKRMDQKTISYAITDKKILAYKKYYEGTSSFRQFKFFSGDINIPVIIGGFDRSIFIIYLKGKVPYITLINNDMVYEIFVFIFKQLWSRLPY